MTSDHFFPRRVILFIACSIDGYIARKDGGIDWLFSDQDYGYTPFRKSYDTVIMGRKTYEQVLSFGPYPDADCTTLVLSRSRAGVTDAHARFTDMDVRDIISGVRGQPGKDIWLVGGGEVIREFLAADLVDEIVLSIHPLVLGEGLPLFLPQPAERRYETVDAMAYRGGLVQIRYRRVEQGNR